MVLCEYEKEGASFRFPFKQECEKLERLVALESSVAKVCVILPVTSLGLSDTGWSLIAEG